ncbi:NUDIX hydrolase [Luteolibacter pohnpeiensis]|uniref:NUDIX hydrolase n=1 Tax=Luteolibacter pohnpeiensis TaxID=454153 RepID=A0A934S625_9BACT|nr:NUDIX hydrolase [Luteolibacter pohnpeiensis]MBK1881431.1 NUDIX hydrolase [Luteolibacter pohnpeiensis]
MKRLVHQLALPLDRTGRSDHGGCRTTHPRSSIEMHRNPLLQALEIYRNQYPDELETVRRFADFVASNENCFERSLAIGHVTGSAWLVNEAGTEVLLTHHRKLNLWLQLGGHADGDADVLAVAKREAFEESGLKEIVPVAPEILDIDIHRIPARKDEPEHFHYDVRYAMRAVGDMNYVVSDESHDLRWVPINEVRLLTEEPSMLRMAEKWQRYQ